MMFGLANEAGETVGKMKKIIRGDLSLSQSMPLLAAELGDVLWYVAGCAEKLGFSLEEIARMNLKKLEDRQLRGKLQGDGDTR